jgi:hypothetical protein
VVRKAIVIRAVLALACLAACPDKASDEDDDQGASEGGGEETTSESGASEETGMPLDCSECGEVAECHSYIGGDGMCYCEAGYEWEPTDPDGFTCVPHEPRPNDECTDPNATVVDGSCYCVCGYTWCSTDPADLSCCPSDDTECGTTGS